MQTHSISGGGARLGVDGHGQDAAGGEDDRGDHVQAEADPARGGQERKPPGAVVVQRGREQAAEARLGAEGANGRQALRARVGDPDLGLGF